MRLNSLQLSVRETKQNKENILNSKMSKAYERLVDFNIENHEKFTSFSHSIAKLVDKVKSLDKNHEDYFSEKLAKIHSLEEEMVIKFKHEVTVCA